MNDIVERLRAEGAGLPTTYIKNAAADEIERLQAGPHWIALNELKAENAALRTQVENIVKVVDDRLAMYSEIASRNNLTDLGRHAQSVVSTLRKDIDYALQRSTLPHRISTNG